MPRSEVTLSRRILIVVAVLLLALAAVGVFATVRLLEPESLLAGRLSAATGRQVTIARVHLRPGLRVGLRAEDVVIGEPSEPSPLRTARIGRLDLVFGLWPLLRREIELSQIEADRVELVVEPGSSGPEAGGVESGDAQGWTSVVGRATARDVEIQVRRDGGVRSGRIERLRLAGQHERQVYELSVAGGFEDIDFELSGSFDRRPEISGAASRAALALQGTLAGASISGAGSVEDADGSRSVELRMQAEAPSLHVFARAARRELPRLGPVRASGLLKVRDGKAGLSEIDLVVGNREEAWLEVGGHLQDLAGRQDFSLAAHFGFSDVRVLGPLVGNPPHVGPVAGRATVRNLSGSTAVEEFTVKGGREGVFEIDAEGSFQHLEEVDGLDARVELTARDLAVIGELAGRPLPPIGPVEFSGQVHGKAREVDTDHIRARLDQTHFEGSLSALFPADGRPRFGVEVVVPELHLDDTGVEPASRLPTDEAPRAVARQHVFADTPLDLRPLGAADVRLSARAARVIGVDGPLLRDLELDAGLESGVLSARLAAFHFDGGSISSQLDVDSSTSPPTAALTGTAKGVNLGALVAQIDQDEAYSGLVDAKLDLRTQGDSPQSLASGLDGELVVSCGGGRIATAHAHVMTRDLFHALRKAAGEARPSEVLNCLVVDFAFQNGVGTARTLLLDAQSGLIVGEGSVDLGRERLDLRLVPKPRGASPFRTAATVRVEGPLASPAIEIAKGSLLTSSTAAMLQSIGSAPGAKQSWRRLRGGASDRSPCAKLIGQTSSASDGGRSPAR